LYEVTPTNIEMVMPHYIVLGNYTEQGIRSIKESVKRDEDVRRIIERAGGKVQLYYTLGEYDFVVVLEMPSDESLLRFLLQVGQAGNVRAKTLKAWSEPDAHKVMSQLP
jgi:uncharacterized protein with GYD domain